MAHERRVRFAARFPLHVTLRMKEDVPSLRRRGPLRVVQQAIREAGHHAYFRVVHFAVIGNHIHLIVEADGADALARGMHSLECRLAKRLDRDWIDPFSSAYWFDGWKGPVRLREPRQRELLNVPQPTASPSVWLLTTGWRRLGPLAFDELASRRR